MVKMNDKELVEEIKKLACNLVSQCHSEKNQVYVNGKGHFKCNNEFLTSFGILEQFEKLKNSCDDLHRKIMILK
jgi:thiamine biosynthesis protein ThiC